MPYVAYIAIRSACSYHCHNVSLTDTQDLSAQSHLKFDRSWQRRRRHRIPLPIVAASNSVNNIVT